MAGHSIKQCLHGFVLSRCRCMGPHFIVRVPCPGPGELGAFSRHSEFVAKLEIWAEIVKDQPTLRSELGAALREAMDEAESQRLVVGELRHSADADLERLHYLRGRSSGIAKAIEILREFS